MGGGGVCNRLYDEGESVGLDLSTVHAHGPPSLSGKDKRSCVPLKGGKDPPLAGRGFLVEPYDNRGNFLNGWWGVLQSVVR